MRRFPPFLKFLAYSILIVAALITLYPVLRVISMSFRPHNTILTTGLNLFPDSPTLENYLVLFTERSFLLWIGNSLAITGVTAGLAVSIATLSAYALTRWKFRLRNSILLSIFFTQLIPGSVMLVPTYLMILKLNLVNTYPGLLLSYAIATVPFSIWLLRGYFMGIEVEPEEAAMIDGAGPLRIFYSVLLPQAVPVLAVVFILSFMASWSEFILARMILVNQNMHTWPLGLEGFSDQYRTLYGAYSASAVLISVPAVAVFMKVSGALHTGLARGSGKGMGNR